MKNNRLLLYYFFKIYFERTQSLLSIFCIVYTLQYSRIADQRLRINSPPTEYGQ